MKLLLATANEHKIQEISAMLDGIAGLELISIRSFPQLQLPEEVGVTMKANALLKALHCARETGLPSLADDSGIEVDALHGAPGIRSARWHEGTDSERTRALLALLNDVTESQRGARYRCAICVMLPVTSVSEVDISPFKKIQVEAVCEGRISREPRGANGFGYDPIFEITDLTGANSQWIGRTMAEAPAEVKAGISHRARALRLVEASLQDHGISTSLASQREIS